MRPSASAASICVKILSLKIWSMGFCLRYLKRFRHNHTRKHWVIHVYVLTDSSHSHSTCAARRSLLVPLLWVCKRWRPSPYRNCGPSSVTVGRIQFPELTVVSRLAYRRLSYPFRWRKVGRHTFKNILTRFVCLANKLLGQIRRELFRVRSCVCLVILADPSSDHRGVSNFLQTRRHEG